LKDSPLEIRQELLVKIKLASAKPFLAGFKFGSESFAIRTRPQMRARGICFRFREIALNE
jgi:hypothetical protein